MAVLFSVFDEVPSTLDLKLGKSESLAAFRFQLYVQHASKADWNLKLFDDPLQSLGVPELGWSRSFFWQVSQDVLWHPRTEGRRTEKGRKAGKKKSNTPSAAAESWDDGP